MNPTHHVATLRQTHRAATSMLPVLTATLTVAGAVLAALEARSAHERREEAESNASATQGAASAEGEPAYAAPEHAGRVTVRGYLATLVGHMLMVTLGIALVLSLVYAASASGRIGQAILLTALILLTLYLTEKVARRA